MYIFLSWVNITSFMESFIQKTNQKKIKCKWYLFQNTYCLHNIYLFKESLFRVIFFLKHSGVFNYVRDKECKE